MILLAWFFLFDTLETLETLGTVLKILILDAAFAALFCLELFKLNCIAWNFQSERHSMRFL